MALSYSDYSATLSIIYFVVNIIFMFGLAFYVYKSGNHKLKSKSYIKDVWSQRKIFFPLIIHFYDTATDIGVIYNWSQLMKHEEDEDLNINYESVDMSTFFWCGIAFLIVYRVIMLMMALYAWLDEDEDGEWYHVLLVIIDLYIFLMVYESFSEANGVITKNAERKQKNAERKKQKRHEAIDKQLQVAVEMGQISTNEVKAIQIALNDELAIEPTERQMILQLIEGIRMSVGANNSGGLKSFEFQINGIWRGRIGSHEPINEQELLLDADEYVNKARLKGLTGVHFFTNKGNVVEAGTLGEDEEGIVTLQGDFRLVDCKGTCDTE
eukprot:459865_1